MADLQPMQKRAYHIDGGAKMMYVTDANAAVQNHPDEWAWAPFSASERDAYRKRVVEEHKEAVKAATASGQQPPPPPVLTPDVEPSGAMKSEMDADTKARTEAAEVVRVAEEKERKEREEAEKVAAAKALLQSPPPQPDPNERRPVAPADRRPGRPTNAEIAARAAAERAAAEAAAKAAADKKKMDQEANIKKPTT